MSIEKKYEELIESSYLELETLKSEVTQLEEIRKNIENLIGSNDKLPKIFEEKFKKIIKQSEDYSKALGVATKDYLDGSNTLFTSKLSELSGKINEFEREITRLVITDFAKLFKDLQKVFIDQTRADLATELKRFEEKSKDLQIKVDELKREIGRLESIDLEKNFAKLQNTLSEIFGAINNINLTLTTVTQTLNNIIQSLGSIQASIEKYQVEVKQLINSFLELTNQHLERQDTEAKRNAENIESKIKLLSDQNRYLSKQIWTNRLISIIGFVLTIVVLGLMIYKLKFRW